MRGLNEAEKKRFKEWERQIERMEVACSILLTITMVSAVACVLILTQIRW